MFKPGDIVILSRVAVGFYIDESVERIDLERGWTAPGNCAHILWNKPGLVIGKIIDKPISWWSVLVGNKIYSITENDLRKYEKL